MGVMTEDKIVMMPINKIRPYVRNPRKNDKTVELLCKLIPKVGFNVPLVIDKNGVIVKGHARFTAAIRLGMKELPCIVSHASEEAIKADRITDNKISEFSEWVNDEVQEEIESINLDFDFSDLGFISRPVEDMPTEQEQREEMSSDSVGEPYRGNDMDNSTKASNEIAVKKRFYKCVCEQCGHVMFIDANRFSRK